MKSIKKLRILIAMLLSMGTFFTLTAQFNDVYYNFSNNFTAAEYTKLVEQDCFDVTDSITNVKGITVKLNRGNDSLARDYIFENESDSLYFMKVGGGSLLKKHNATFLFPKYPVWKKPIIVKEVIANNIIKVEGDLTAFAQKKFNNLTNPKENREAYIVHKGYNQEYQQQFGQNGEWPHFDGSYTYIYIQNGNPKIAVGDHLIFFEHQQPQFNEVYLPKVNQSMVNDSSILRLQIVAADGNNIQIHKNKGKKQYLKSDNTKEANIALNLNSNNQAFSLELRASKIDDGFGWTVTNKNENYYNDTISSSSSANEGYVEVCISKFTGNWEFGGTPKTVVTLTPNDFKGTVDVVFEDFSSASTIYRNKGANWETASSGNSLSLSSEEMGDKIQLTIVEKTSSSDFNFAENEDASITVYPNPSNGIVNISGTKTNGYIRVLDLCGKVILDKVFKKGQKQIDISNLTKGVYVIQFYDNNRKPIIKKLMVE